jgi:chemotaxis-related protein WspB
MLFLLFQVGAARYVLDTARVAEVLPLVGMKQIPLAPRGVAGLFSYHGAPVPAIDLSLLALGTAAPRRLSTRLIVVRHRDQTGTEQLLGLVAERATQTLRREASDFVRAGVNPGEAPYLGPVATHPGGIIQWVEVDRLLSPAVREVLFRASGEDG